MKVYYQGNVVGLSDKVHNMMEMFRENIQFSPNKIIACRCNNEVKPLSYEFKEGDNVELLDIRDSDGIKVYVRGCLFLMGMAFNELYPEALLTVNYSLSNAMFCEVENMEITDIMLMSIKDKMNQLVKDNLEIVEKNMTKAEAKKFYDKQKTLRGILQLDNEDKDNVTLYFCKDYYNYFYGVMPVSTGFITTFDVERYKNGFIIRYPSTDSPEEIGPFKESKKFLTVLQEYDDIYSELQISTIYQLNKALEEGRQKEIILLSEALHEKRIAEMADKIAKKKGVKIILIAGPSSSGKTTFAKRLGIQLKVNGLKPVTVGTDNYFVERPMTPRDEKGDYDFETIDALDLDLFNDHLTKLINGEEIDVPTFDFKVGTKRYYGKKMGLAEDEILIIEGIHGLNDRLTEKIPASQKYKIYISDLTVLNIDYYNRISTTDTRLIRRIVRDYNYRGYSALETLKRWPSVNNGEKKNIFPYQELSDSMYNSSLVYELSVLNKYAIPLLKQVNNTEREYSEAQRLISFLKYFKPIEDESFIPTNSILREFIGGSIFDY